MKTDKNDLSFKEYIEKMIQFLPDDTDLSKIVLFDFENNQYIHLLEYIRQEKLNQLGISE